MRSEGAFIYQKKAWLKADSKFCRIFLVEIDVEREIDPVKMVGENFKHLSSLYTKILPTKRKAFHTQYFSSTIDLGIYGVAAQNMCEASI